MSVSYTPNGNTSTENIVVPEDGDLATAASIVEGAVKRIADRLKAAVDIVQPDTVFSGRGWRITDGQSSGIALHAIATAALDAAVAISGLGNFGVVGETIGSTVLNKGVSGIARLGTAVGTFGRSIGGAALEGDSAVGIALLARGVIGWSKYTQSDGVTKADGFLHPSASAPYANALLPLNIIKAWGKVQNGALQEGFNCSVTASGLALRNITFASPMQDSNYAVVVSAAGVAGVGVNTRVYGSLAPTGFQVRQSELFVNPATSIITEIDRDMADCNFSFLVLGRQALAD